MNNALRKYFLEAGVLDITEGPMGGRLMDCYIDYLKGFKSERPVTFKVRIPGKKGRTFTATIELVQKTVNPYFRETPQGAKEDWYHGNLYIHADKENGYSGEVRAFAYDAYNKVGKLGKRGKLFTLKYAEKPKESPKFLSLD